jgi:protein TonB
MVLDGWRGDRVRTVGVSFGVSVGIHALLFGLVLWSFSRAAKAPLIIARVKLVYVDPAPAAAPPRGTEEGTAKVAPVVPPPLPVTPRQPVAKPVRPEKRVGKPKPQPEPPPIAQPAPRPVEPAPAEPMAAPAPAEIPSGVANGVPSASGETEGGTPDGVAGGRVGGSGTGVLKLGDVATAPIVMTRVVPEYPRRARLAGIEGEVVLEVVVDRYGRVASDVKVVTAVPELERAAIDAVRKWRFRPARDRAGTAVAVVMEVPVRFVLHEATADASH